MSKLDQACVPSPSAGAPVPTDRERLTAAFEAMTPWARGLLIELAEGYAEEFPQADVVDAAPLAAPQLPEATHGNH